MAPPSPPPSPLPSQPPPSYSDPFASPRNQYSDPFAPPASPYYDPLAPSASPSLDVDSLLSLDNYQSSVAGDDFLQLPENCQFYTGGNSLSLENNQPKNFLSPANNFLSHANYQSSGAGNNFSSLENNQSVAGDGFLLPGNHQPYAGNNNLCHENYPSCAGNNFLSFENIQPYAGNDFLSQEIYPSCIGNNFLSPQNYPPYAGNTSLPLENFQPVAANNFLPPQHSQPYAGNNSLSLENSSISPDNYESDSGDNSPIPPDNYENNSLAHPIPWEWRANLPVGMKFRPTDEELIIYYLKPHILHGASPPGGPVAVVDIYDYEPQQLLGMGEDHGDGRRYFITKVTKIGKLKTDRVITTKRGFWKPTQAPKPIIAATTLNGTKVGDKIPLAFYDQDRRKTQWLMQELKLPKIDHYSSEHHVEIVLAVVYYYHR